MGEERLAASGIRRISASSGVGPLLSQSEDSKLGQPFRSVFASFSMDEMGLAAERGQVEVGRAPPVDTFLPETGQTQKQCQNVELAPRSGEAPRPHAKAEFADDPVGGDAAAYDSVLYFR